jgi:hypothetical protein
VKNEIKNNRSINFESRGELMDQQNTLFGVVLKRFFKGFQHITHHGVPICKLVYRPLMSQWDLKRLKEVFKNSLTESDQITESSIYNWSDDPYPYDPHPNGIVLMRGGFGDVAVQYLPRERCMLLSPNQAEVDLIKLNRPDLRSHNIQSYYRENPAAVQKLNRQVELAVRASQDDPVLGSPVLLKWFQAKMPEIVRMLDAVQRVFEEIPVGAVLTISSTYSMDGALNLIAKAKRIPSLTLQHGLMAEKDLFSHVPILATKKCVWGPALGQWYQKFGFPESRIAIVGAPRFDLIANQTWCGKQKLCQMLKIDPGQKIVVYATQIIRINETTAPVVLEGLKTLPEVTVLMMLHPGENPEPHEKLARGYPNCKTIRFGHVSLYDALSGADCFITCYSTAALEAMLFKLPVITVEPYPLPFSFGKSGGSIPVKNSLELNQVVRRLCADEAFRAETVERYQPFLTAHCLPDGLASRRLFGEIAQLLETRGTA